MLPQPPPDAPAPPMSKAALRSRRWWRWIWGVGIFSVIVVAGLFVLPFTIRPSHFAERTETISNASQIGLALFEFDYTYGSFPDSTTISKVREKYPDSSIPLGTSYSNDFFRQLLVSEMAYSETTFYAHASDSRKPDNVILGAEALKKGECGFAYIAGISPSRSRPETPIVVFPLVPGKLIFDYKQCQKFDFGGKVVILRADMSVVRLPVDKSGHVYVNGKDLFDPTQPYWGGKPPDVKWPE